MTKSETGLEEFSFLLMREEVLGLVGDESLDDVSMASFTGNLKRRDPIVLSWFKTRSSFEEDQDDGMMTMLDGDDERSCGKSFGIDWELVIEEDLDDLRVS